MLAADNARAMLSVSSSALEVLFEVPLVVMIMSRTAVDLIEKRGRFELLDAEFEAARSSLATSKVVPAGMYPFDTSRFDFWPVTTLTGQQAVIGLAFDPDERPFTPGTLVEIVGRFLPWLWNGSISGPDSTRRHVRANISWQPASYPTE